MNINDLIERVSEYDINLAKDLSEYVRGREYGLVFEASKPEFVRMWNKPVVRGDLVNILPPRGEMEDTKSEDDPADITYRYISKNGDKAKLRDIKTQEECEADIEDLVAIARFDQPIYCGLKEKDRIERGDSGEPYQVVINGENYHALQTLAYAYAGKVDCIYIDPPYNTGAEDWKYNNNYVSKEDRYRHSKWLTFIEDRLKVAKRLLNPKDAVLIVTIDEKEYLRLGLLLEQLFPEANIQMVSSIVSRKGAARFNEFTRVNEFIFFVMLGESNLHPLDFADYALEGEQVHWQTFRRSSASNVRTSRPRQFYPLYINPETNKIEKVGDAIPHEMDRFSVEQVEGCVAVFPVRDNGAEMLWGLTPEACKELLKKGYIKASKYNPKKPQQFVVQYLMSGTIDAIDEGKIVVTGYGEDGAIIAENQVTRRIMPKSQWNFDTHDARDFGNKILKNTIGEDRFDFPKSLYAVKDCLNYYLVDKENALVIDFFAGSGTTLHAINLLNAEDKGHRRCICVTNNEVSVEEQKMFTEQKLRQGDSEWEKYGIANYVTWPRTVCSIEGKDVNGNPLIGNYIESDIPMADGFKANAVMYELTYLEPALVSANLAFDEIAPILWLRSGCKGPVIKCGEGYAMGETYAVLFDYSFVNEFIAEMHANEAIGHIFIVTDTKNRYRAMCIEFPDRDVVQLYESYLRSFEINTEV